MDGGTKVTPLIVKSSVEALNPRFKLSRTSAPPTFGDPGAAGLSRGTRLDSTRGTILVV